MAEAVRWSPEAARDLQEIHDFIASDSPGLRESLVPGETGVLVPHGDISALSAAMGRAVDSPETAVTMGKAGRRFAERFTWERSADDTITHLEQAAHGGTSKWK